MNPSDLIPAPDAIPVAWGWFQILLTVTFVVHLLFMNALLGGSIVALLGGVGPGAVGRDASREMSQKLPLLVAFTVNAGVAPLLFLQVLYGHFVYTSSVLIAGWWLAVIPALIVAYYGAYVLARRFDASGALRAVTAGLVTVLLLVVSFLFVNNMSLALTPDRWAAWFAQPDGSLLNLGDPALWPRWLHMVVGAVAVGGLYTAWLQDRKLRRGDEAAGARRDWGLRFFTHGTLLQMILGLWWLMVLPDAVMKLFMGGSPFASAMLLLGVVGGVVAVMFGFQKKVTAAVWTTVATMVVMVLMREIVRFGYLAPHFHPRDLAVAPQMSPLILFLVVFVIGLGCVAYMLRLAVRAGKEG